jgi:hypothetical protein
MVVCFLSPLIGGVTAEENYNKPPILAGILPSESWLREKGRQGRREGIAMINILGVIGFYGMIICGVILLCFGIARVIRKAHKGPEIF